MAILTFEKIRWKNFLSTGNSFTEIELNKFPNTLIIGNNGAGKSTLLDALTFSLFGKSFRNINKSNLINSVNGKDCVVEIEFNTHGKKYKVIRGIKPTVFEVYCDNKLLNQDSATKDYQDNLEKFILRMNYKSFTQIVILGSASFTPFMQLSAADRRLVIEDLLDIQIFSVMNSIAKQKLADNKSKLEKNRIESLGKSETCDHIKRTIESLKQNDDQKLKELEHERVRYEKAIKKINEEIQGLDDQRNEILQQTTSYKNLKSRQTKLISLKSQIETNHKKQSCELSFFEKHDNCPTCKQAIDETFKSNKVDSLTNKIVDLNDGISKIVSEIDSCVLQIEEIENKLETINKLSNQISQNKYKSNQFSEEVIKLQKEMDFLSKSNSLLENNENDLLKIQNEIATLEKEKESLLNEKLYIETSVNLLKDGGIKTKIIKQYLPTINKLINKYLTQMNFSVNFNIDENFKETIKSRYRDEFAYQNFSEGEKIRIDLALLFTWREISKLRSSVSTNLLIFDEIFDGSLDDSGTDEFLKIMWSLIGDSNVFVISHKHDQMTDKFKRTIKFSKKKNFSVLSTP